MSFLSGTLKEKLLTVLTEKLKFEVGDESSFFSAFGNSGPPYNWSREKSEIFLDSDCPEVVNTFGWDFAGNNQDSGYKEVNVTVTRLFEIKSMFGFFDFQ